MSPIEVVPYNPDWSLMFDAEATKIKEALGNNCVAIHHIGSTSVYGLAAKPKIDIIAVVISARSIDHHKLAGLGFRYKGEYNIPMRLYFSRSEGTAVNLHVYEDNHPEIELNLLFRDYLRKNQSACDEYVNLKNSLLKDSSSFQKTNSVFTGYNLGKDAFIRKILKKAQFNRIRFTRCAHYDEWETAKHYRQKYFFDKIPIDDPYVWTFNHPSHAHFVLYIVV